MKIEFKDVNLATLLGEEAGNVIVKTMEKTFQQYFERMATKEYMSIKEACEYIGVAFTTFQKFRQMNLPVIEIDGVKRVKKSDIDEWLEQYKI